MKSHIKLWLIIIIAVITIICIGIKYTNASYDYKDLTIKWVKKPNEKIFNRLKNECVKQKVKNINHCIKTWLSIAYAESSFKDNHTPFWLKSKDKSYKKWVSSYKKYWYTAKDWSRFYWNWKPSPTRYCTEEDSSKTVWWCPNWQKNFNKIFFNLSYKK